MSYYGLVPTTGAIQQACREPLDGAPKGHQAFAVYIFDRAREIDGLRAIDRRAETVQGTRTVEATRSQEGVVTIVPTDHRHPERGRVCLQCGHLPERGN